MAPTVRDITSQGYGNDTSANPARPAGTTEGDLLIAFATSDADGNLAAMTAPAGWSLLGQSTGTDGVMPPLKVWRKIATSSETTTYTFPDANGAQSLAAVMAITGHNAASPIAAGATFNLDGSFTTSHTAPSVTGVAGGLLITAFVAGDNLSFTPPTGMTEILDVPAVTTGSAFCRLAVNTQELGADGSTGTRVSTSSDFAKCPCVSLVVAPAAAAGPPPRLFLPF